MILVAMPAYNEERYIRNMVIETLKYADEVIVLNDGSTDDTSEVAKRVGATVISHDKNLGYGATIITILSEARKRAFGALVIIKPKERGMAIGSEVILEVAKAHLNIIEVPISIKYTKDSSTINPVVQGVYTLYRIIVMLWRKTKSGVL